jgi:dipeptidase D
MSPGVLDGLEPRLVWARFAELTEVPRPSKEEEAARAHVLGWAGERGLETGVDAAGNVVVRVPATPGREQAPPVILQAHLDMVCERDPDSPFDPREGRIHVVRDGDWVLAEGTTLGADNGIGVAAAMAAAEDPSLSHGPLELLFTVSEEKGLAGAKALDASFVSGRLLVNLDGTSDGALTVGCAGSAHAFTRVPLDPQPLPDDWATLAIAVSGAKGGHSGGDIAKDRANAIKALGRVLSPALGRTPLRLARLEGGASRNALPRQARAVVALDRGSEDAFRRAAARAFAELRERYRSSDAGLELSVEPAEPEPAALESVTSHALDVLATIPSGVLAMSAHAPDTVETSTSLNVATTEDGALVLASMTRSASESALEEVVATFEAIGRLDGASVEILRSYPPWQPDLDSSLLAAGRAAFAHVFGGEPRLEVVHGGLECAVLRSRLPGVEMISIGPEIVGPHAPGERLGISGTERFYRLLGAMLGEVSS